MINRFNFKKISDKYLITNDLGEYVFLSNDCFKELIDGKLEKNSDVYNVLKSKHFVFDNTEEFLEEMSFRIRSYKDHLFRGPTLFIFVVSTLCNHDCIYCQAKHNNTKCYGKMDTHTANKAIDIVFNSPEKEVDIEFQGGEPLTNFEIIKHIILEAESRAIHLQKLVSFSIVTNLTLMTDEIFFFLRNHNVSISTSLDGNNAVHNTNRPTAYGEESYNLVTERIRTIQKNGENIGVIQTTTKHSLEKHKEIIDAYIANGLKNIYIRALTPLGKADDNWDIIGYSADEFVDFYRKCLNYIIEININGITFVEGTAVMILKKALCASSMNHMEYRSPCGAAIGQVAFYYNGSVYTCDEGRMVAEMGDDSFKLGSVDNSYDELLNSTACKSICASSVLESLPECCDCVYQPYCGVCPVINYKTQGDLYNRSPNNYRCKINKGIYDAIFSILKDEDSVKAKVLRKWIEEYE